MALNVSNNNNIMCMINSLPCVACGAMIDYCIYYFNSI